jgi:hypothetical protein
MATLSAALAAIQNSLRTLPGVTTVPDAPPEQIAESIDLPAIYSYPLSGSWAYGAARGTGMDGAFIWGLHTIAVNLWVARKDLPTDLAAAAEMAALIPKTLMETFDRDQFGGTVTQLGRVGSSGAEPIRYEFAAFRWGGLDLVGWQFQVDLTLEQELT